MSFKPRLIYPQGKAPSPRYPLDRGWVGPRAGLEDIDK
jgi:hypothetical protein